MIAIDSVTLLEKLVRFPSVSATSNVAISDFVADQLDSLGFQIERINYVDVNDVPKTNVVAKRAPKRVAKNANESASSGFAYFAHTDVVPADRWTGPPNDRSTTDSNPFEPEVFESPLHDQRIYGRGACDMKGSLASMIAAVSSIDVNEQTKPIWITATADEEIGFEGALKVTANSELYRELIDQQPLAIIGEPTELQLVHAHKGIKGFEVISRGRAGHSSRDDGVNANELMIPILHQIHEIGLRSKTDARLINHQFDPPHLSWNYGVSDHMRTINITPGYSRAWVSLRTMPGIDGEDLIDQVRQSAESAGLEFNRIAGGDPVWTDPKSKMVEAVADLANSKPSTVCYGTDGCVLNELRHRIVLGPGSIEQAHTVDEWISLDQLQRGQQLYESILRRFATAGT